jgi:light-regulated signal transduction histidine kinase (bacteriophytochrome)/CheY-like chemotaxis protein
MVANTKMTFKVDLTNCDREPIHIPGSIQPHGVMLVCNSETFKVGFASANATAFLGTGSNPCGTALSDVIGEQAAHDLRNASAKAGGSEVSGVVLRARLSGLEHPVDMTIHRHKDLTFVEIELSGDESANAEGALDFTQGLIRRISLETDVISIATTGAKLVRAMLGYDRVMVYQFLHNGAGRVIAEAKQTQLASFMGQHFPATDIPDQARRLYTQNTIRMIGDVAYAPIPLLPPLAEGQTPIDMSFAQLRSVSPIHCEYLTNMGVHASLSISIVIDRELWGLISCHHNSPKVIPVPLRIGAELFGQYFSMQVSAAGRRAEVAASNRARDQLGKIIGGLEAEESLSDSLAKHLSDFVSLISCDGAAVWIDGIWTGTGATPEAAEIGPLTSFVTRSAKASVWHNQELRAALNSDVYGTDIAGVLAIPLSSTPRDYLFFFRSEEAHNIEWAGEPVKKVIQAPEGERLTPRGSFTTWREDVRGKCRPWAAPDVAMAEAIRTYLRDIVLRHNEITAEERALAEQRRRVLNDELNHRVKNIIALVKSIALQTGAHALSVADYSASLEGRLKALAFAHDQSLVGGSSGDLGMLIEAEASLHRYGNAPDRVTVSGPTVRLGERTFGVLALVIHEMMTNAAKYGALSVPEGKLALRWCLLADGDCEITWEERGGPPVAKPLREGFGSKLIQNTLAYDLGGVAEVHFESSGVWARFLIPGKHVSVGDYIEDISISVEIPPPTSLSGLKVLVVEDQALIAMDVEATLRKLGAVDVKLAPSTLGAALALRNFTPDVAILDFNLGNETSEVLADEFVKNRIPFVFATGYADNVLIPERFRNVPLVRKPVIESLLALKIESAREAA